MMVRLKQLCLCGLTGITLLLLLEPLEALTGTYMTFDYLTNKRLPYTLAKISTNSTDTCQKLCKKNSKCEAFAYSKFEKMCSLYALLLGEAPVSNTGYNLYVRTKSPDEGYYIFESQYMKLMLTMMNAQKARNECKKMKGDLVAIRSEGLNNMLVKIMTAISVHDAFIGITDEAEEGKWKYYDTNTDTVYNNWAYDGQWYRRDKNCAIIDETGEWRQQNCGDVKYFFCQIPMF